MIRLFSIISLLVIISSSMLFGQNDQVLSETNSEELLRLSSEWKKKREADMIVARKKAIALGLEMRQEFEDGTIIEVQGLDELGNLMFYKTENKDGARTISTDDVWPGGSAGLSLNGSGMKAGEWDGGAVLGSHQELVNRVIQVDSSTVYANHATHVAGTIIGAGVDTAAKGMAYAANLDAYDWSNDDSEMAAAAAAGLLISNHSYGNITGWYFNSGWQWWGDTTISGSEDYNFGFYNFQSQAWDQIARNAPYYLIVKSAGNDRGDINSTSSHYLPQHGVFSSTTRPADGGTSGYDCISTYSGAKNILTIGAVNGISNGYSGPSSVVMSSFSGWGPTDDGRIKPDLVTKGVAVKSCLADSNNAYATWNGTSMATPGATGALLLLQEHYNDTYSTFMKAATLKALAIHTADEAGPNPGPDYMFGWGLMNTAKAALHISDSSGTKGITETSVSNGSTYSTSVSVNGLSPIKVTIAWTDVPGTPVSASLDPTNAMLVNDLDVRIIRNSDSTIYYPYTLNPQSPASAASTGDNQRDNVEQIYIAAPASGSYTIVVSHKGTLSGGSSQNFSLILDGGIGQAQPLNCSGIIQAPFSWDFDTLVNCSTTSGSACAIPVSVGWTNDTSDDIDWTIDNATTGSSNTGPSVDYTTGTTTGKFLYTEASTSGTGFPNKTAVLNSACINLDTMNNTELFFAYHMYGSTMGSLSVEAYSGFSWSQVWTLSGDQGDVWNTAKVDLSLYDGDTIQLRFVGITGSNYFSDMAIDGIQIREGLSCPGPFNFIVSNITDTTAVVGWSSSSTVHKIHLKIKGGNTVIAPVNINFNPVLFSGLIPNTTYELFVQDSCGLNDTSLWIGPIEFTTSGPIQNPTPCLMGASIPDDNCPIMSYLPVQVSTFGTQLGVDVQLREVRVIIDHTYVGDLQFSIASPAGDTVLLSKYNGGSGYNYGDPGDGSCLSTTRFTMSGDSLITSSVAPFIGTYIPEEPFSIINNGSNPNGFWKFIVCDDVASDVGTLEHLEFVFDTVANQAGCTFQTVGVGNDGIDTICAGDTASLFPTHSPLSVGNLTYQWYRNGQLLTGETSSFHEAFLTGSYNVMLTDSNNCSDSAFTGQWLEVLNPPVVTISNLGNDTLCPGDSTTLICNSGVEYSWMKNGSFISPPQDGQSITVGDSGNYNVLLVDQFSCYDTAAVAYSIEEGIDPVIQLSLIGDTTFCLGGSSVLKATGAQTYQWYRNGIALSGMTDDSLVVSQQGHYNAYGYSPTNCGDSAISGISIIVNSLPVVVITNTGNSTFCMGDSTELSSSSGSSYQWYKNGGSISGSTSSMLVVNTSGDYNVLVTDSNLCIDSASSATSIVVNSLPNVIITNLGNDTICDGDTATLVVPTGNTYQWFKNGQVINGATNYYYGVMDSGSYNVLVTDSNMCTDSAAVGKRIFLNPRPVVNINAGSQPLFCQGDSVILTTISGSTYQWWKNGAIIPGPGATGQNYIARDSGFYNVRVSNAFNCWDSASSPILVVVNKLPVPDITVVGDSVFCDGDSTTLSTASGLQYQWYKGSILLPGQTQNTLLVRSSGTYNVFVTDMNNCSDSSRFPTVVMTNPLPLISISSNASSICEGDSATITAPPGFAYQWRRNGQFLPGKNARFLFAKQAGTYNVVATNINFCADTASVPVTITVNDLPQVSMDSLSEMCNTSPKILLSGGLPIGGVYSGVGVSGVSGQYFFDPVISGVGAFIIKYTFTDGNNCSNSDTRIQAVRNCVGISDQYNDGLVQFFPNPTKGTLYISVPDQKEGSALLQVYDVRGQIVATRSIEEVASNNVIEVNLNGLSDGVYFVHLRLGSEIFKQKIILEKN